MSPRGPKTIRAGLIAAAERPLAQLALNLPKTAGDDPFDPIHDTRVALRRLGSLLRAFAPVLPAYTVAEIKREVRWLRHILGPARDLDVFIHETAPKLNQLFPGEAGLNMLLEEARRQRIPLRAAVARAVGSARCRKLLALLQHVFGERAGQPPNRGQRASAQSASLDSPLVPYVRRLLRKRYKKLRKQAQRVEKLGEHDLHRLRIRLRNFRYLCDGFRDILSERRYAHLRTALQQLQDHLGALNDAATAPALAAALARAAGNSHDPALVARTAGFVSGWGEARRQVLRASLGEPWHRMVKRADRIIGAL